MVRGALGSRRASCLLPLLCEDPKDLAARSDCRSNSDTLFVDQGSAQPACESQVWLCPGALPRLHQTALSSRHLDQDYHTS